MHKLQKKSKANGNGNKLLSEDRAAHDWYRFILSFPPHLVREYLEKFGANQNSVVLDPFCGTGTTVVECKKLGIPSIGIEANQMAYFASKVKTSWSPSPSRLLQHSKFIANLALQHLKEENYLNKDSSEAWEKIDKDNLLRKLSDDQRKLILKNSISPIPLHKTLTLLDLLNKHKNNKYLNHEKLALANELVYSISNLYFGPEVGVRRPKEDAPVVTNWLEHIEKISNDLVDLKELQETSTKIIHADSRQIKKWLNPNSIDIVITSPPYPNEKDYTRTTRLESVLLGFIQDRKQLRSMKEKLIRSNTRNVYVSDKDDEWIKDNTRIRKIAEEIENKRIELGKTSGFERLYARATKLYFGGMARHIALLRDVLKPGAQLAYVVGDQASYFRVKIKTGEILAEIAESLGYKIIGIDLFRTRFATATKKQLREEVVVLRWQ